MKNWLREKKENSKKIAIVGEIIVKLRCREREKEKYVEYVH